MAAYTGLMTNVTCGLTAKKPGSDPGPMLIIKYGTTLFLHIYCTKNLDISESLAHVG